MELIVIVLVLTMGLIKRSTLGPLLYSIYIKNISKLKVKGNIFLLSDDTVLVSTGCTWDKVFEQAAEDLSKLNVV